MSTSPDDQHVTAPIATQRVGDFADAVAGDAPTPGGGAVAGTVAALAAALVGMAGRYSVRTDPGLVSLRALVQTAERLRARALLLADADAAVYGRYLQATRAGGAPDDRRVAVRAALDAAADVPFELNGLAADVADAAEELAVGGNPRLRSDACAAALLASAVASTTAILVQDNLRSTPQDERRSRAVQRARDAGAAAERAVGAHSSMLQAVSA